MKTVIEMAIEAGATFDHMTWVERDLAPVFERFAALVREDEREACAKVCDQEVEFHERNAELEEDADYANRCRVYAKHVRTCARYIRAGLR